MSLRRYLNAPPQVQRAFDKEQSRKIEATLKRERWAEQELAGDPVAEEVKARRELEALIAGEPIVETLRVEHAGFDERWQRRATAARRATATNGHRPYDRDADPLLGLDLREVWVELTGEEPNGAGRVRCPNPDHEDRFPDCALWADRFHCFACAASGSIIDLGALLYGLEPRGRDFFRTRERLLAELGMAA